MFFFLRGLQQKKRSCISIPRLNQRFFLGEFTGTSQPFQPLSPLPPAATGRFPRFRTPGRGKGGDRCHEAQVSSGGVARPMLGDGRFPEGFSLQKSHPPR